MNTFYNKIRETLEEKDTINKQCVIYFGNFNNNTGSYSLEKELYSNILNSCRDKFKKCRLNNIKEYYYNDMVISIDQNKKEVYRVEHLDYGLMNDRLCFFVKNKESLELERFPIINKYHNVINKTITVFNNNPIIISLICEKKEDNIVYSITLSFYNKCENKNWLVGKLKETIEYISNQLYPSNVLQL